MDENEKGGLIRVISSVLDRLCGPAAEEFGLILRDRFRYWRLKQAESLAKRVSMMLEANSVENANAHPRVVARVLDEASWVEDETVQNLWAGLLVSACTESGDDDSNLIFVSLLSRMSKLQARVLLNSCEKAKKEVLPNGLIQANRYYVSTKYLIELTGEQDLHRIDRELDNLRDLGLLHIHSGFQHGDVADIGPSPLALHMFVRCHGSRKSPIDFFALKSGTE